VIVDIDDTLWRGVAAERTDSLPYTMLEGWPLGFAEALGYLHRRGVLLAIVSKNDEARVTEIWNRIYGGRLTFDDFAVRKINWRSKADNIEEILRQINLLPYSVIFIDDNPAERAAVAAAFPGIRTFGSNPLVWRRILLWSPETQVATITSESASRTEMIQAQITREEHRQRLSRDEFLKSLDLKLNLFEIDGVAHRAFPRVLELINKTNQFNTTGKRWTEQECMAAFAAGCRFLAFEVEDRFTAYGLVGVIVVKGACIAQFVMSCRVAGMDVEIAAVAEVARLLGREGQNTVWGSMVETPLNLLCRDLYKRCGFVEADGEWQRHTIPFPDMPDYVRVINEAAAEAA
jgi:FkbH-like protein